MRHLAQALALSLILTGCAKKEDEVASAASDEPKAAATAAPVPPPNDKVSSQAKGTPGAAASSLPETDNQDTPLGAVALPDMARCARRCVVQNQMRAVAPEQIEADCRKECHSQCLEFCKAGQGDRPVGFEGNCRADCDKERDRLQEKR